ncbi:MAG: methionyl-tRNA formyltransferase [Gemmataceae bacterium]|nr:methionyl-tRNA formyltransferase [Gemmataceae bacterium]
MRLVMMGTGSFAQPTFEVLLQSAHSVVGMVTQPDRAVGKERGSTRQAGRGMKELAQERGIPVLQPESINTPDSVQALAGLKPDLLVVAAYGQILSKDVLAVPPQGGINVHASLLPKYRGAAPIAWAIYHGETESGVTIIRMSASLDAGAMLAQEAVVIGPEETAGELEARLAPLGATLALRVMEQIEKGTVQAIPQDKSQATKAPKLQKEHGLIDWARPAEAVCNQIRAMQPWPTAYTYLHRPEHEPLRLIVSKARVEGSPYNIPIKVTDKTGKVLAKLLPILPEVGSLSPVAGNRLLVQTGQGLTEVLELQPAGKKHMVAADFLRGHPAQVGWRFGAETA